MKSARVAFTALLAAAAVTACDVDQVREGRLPDVDVDVEAGELPAYDVDVADVDVGMEEDTIIVSHPTVDVDMPDDDDDEEGNSSGNRGN